jgi:FkbM family methyltransferase
MLGFYLLIRVYDFGYRIYMRLYGKLRPQFTATTIYDGKIRCAVSDFIQRRIAFFGVFEPNHTELTVRLLQSGDTYIDVGANIGYFTIMAAKCVGPTGKVYSIEAEESTYRLLLENLRLNGLTNVEPLHMAVADQEGFARIGPIDSRNIGTARVSFIDAPGTTMDAVVARPLAVIVGDRLAQARLIKVDVEGAEAKVLPGIFRSIADAESQTIVVAEINEENAHLIQVARREGFIVRAMPNTYTISHLLIRSVLRRTDEDRFCAIRRVESYVPNCDFVFSRGPIVFSI